MFALRVRAHLKKLLASNAQVVFNTAKPFLLQRTVKIHACFYFYETRSILLHLSLQHLISCRNGTLKVVDGGIKRKAARQS